MVLCINLLSIGGVPGGFVGEALKVALEEVDLLEGFLQLVLKHLDLKVFLLEFGSQVVHF